VTVSPAQVVVIVGGEQIVVSAVLGVFSSARKEWGGTLRGVPE
jgi:hypothetical protein